MAESSVWIWILGSIFFSTSLIMSNKRLMTVYEWHSPMFLTSIHLFCTWIFSELMVKIGWIKKAVTLPTSEKWFLGAMSIVTIVGQNMNLMYNSVGFYQLSKLCCIPFTVVYTYFVYQKKTPLNICASLVILLIGLVLFSVNDIYINLFGTIVALIITPIGSINTILNQTKQEQYGINGPSLQHAIAFPSFVCCILAAIAMETTGTNSIFTNNLDPKIVGFAFCTGLLAVGVNMCTLGLIGKTSAVTYLVVGHVKTMLIFVFGLIFFKDARETASQQTKKIIGLIIAMVGVVIYSVLDMKFRQSQKKAKEEEVAAENDVKLLDENEQFQESVEGDGNEEEEKKEDL